MQIAMSGGIIEPESSASSELLLIINLSYSFLPVSSEDLTAVNLSQWRLFLDQITHKIFDVFARRLLKEFQHRHRPCFERTLPNRFSLLYGR